MGRLHSLQFRPQNWVPVLLQQAFRDGPTSAGTDWPVMSYPVILHWFSSKAVVKQQRHPSPTPQPQRRRDCYPESERVVLGCLLLSKKSIFWLQEFDWQVYAKKRV